MKGKVCKTNVDTGDKFPACFMDAAGSIKKREDQLRRTTRDFSTQIAKCTEFDGGILGTFIVNCNIFVIYV